MKKLFFFIVFLMAGMCYGQIFNGFIDTVYYTNGKTKVCKILKQTDSLLLFQTKDSTGILDWRVSKTKITKYIDNTPADRFMYDIVVLNEVKSEPVITTSTERPLLTLKDSINFLMNKNNSLLQQQDRIYVNFKNVGIAGNRIKNAGLFSLVALGSGIISGLCIGFNQESRTPEYAMNAGYIFAGIAAVCSIAVPIELITAGKRIKYLK